MSAPRLNIGHKPAHLAVWPKVSCSCYVYSQGWAGSSRVLGKCDFKEPRKLTNSWGLDAEFLCCHKVICSGERPSDFIFPAFLPSSPSPFVLSLFSSASFPPPLLVRLPALVSLNVGKHTLSLSVVLLHADSLVLLLTESIGKKIAGWVLQARYVIML